MNNTQQFYHIYFCYFISTSYFIYISLMLDFQCVIALLPYLFTFKVGTVIQRVVLTSNSFLG